MGFEPNHDSFRHHLKARFKVQLEGAEVDLTLTEVKRLSTGEREGGAFSLLWEGPASSPLQQGTYRLEAPQGGAFDIFIVPVAEAENLLKYEAIYA